LAASADIIAGVSSGLENGAASPAAEHSAQAHKETDNTRRTN
jgi:hypothetical protein